MMQCCGAVHVLALWGVLVAVMYPSLQPAPIHRALYTYEARDTCVTQPRVVFSLHVVLPLVTQPAFLHVGADGTFLAVRPGSREQVWNPSITPTRIRVQARGRMLHLRLGAECCTSKAPLQTSRAANSRFREKLSSVPLSLTFCPRLKHSQTFVDYS